MSLQTPNRIHAAAVCFWEVISTGPPYLFTVGFQSRHNFSAAALGASDNPREIRLTMVQPVAKAEAVALFLPDVDSDIEEAGLSIGPPATPDGDPFIDDTPLDAVAIWKLRPPDRIQSPAGDVGDRANFYVMVLAVPPAPELLVDTGEV